MKSSRSLSLKITRRNARRLMSESSDYSDDEESVDSARAEKVFSLRRLPPTSNDGTRARESVQAERTLFRLSDSSDSDSSRRNFEINSTSSKKNLSVNSSQSTINKKSWDKSIVDSSMNQSLVKPSKNIAHNYRNILQSSDDEETGQSDIRIINTSLESKKSTCVSESDQSVEDDIVEEIIDKSCQYSSENDTSHESFFITPKKNKNKQRIVSDSSSENDTLTTPKKFVYNKEVDIILESDVSLESKSSSVILESDQGVEDNVVEAIVNKSDQYSSESDTNHQSFFITPKKKGNKQKIPSDSSSENADLTTSKMSFNNKEIDDIILVSDSDGIVNSSKKKILTPNKKNFEESKFKTKLKDLSLIEPSDSDTEIPAHCISTITSSKQSRPLFELSVIANSVHSPISQSSILENENKDFVSTSSVQQNKKSIEIINLDDSFAQFAKVSPSKQYNPVTVDLTKNEFDKFAKSSKLSVMTGHDDSLKMEKKRLEELFKHHTSNIKNMKNTMKMTNLHLLPDGGLKLKKAILKEERSLIDTEMQLKNVLDKIKHFPEKPKLSPTSDPMKSSNIENVLQKKAAANIDINAMGSKALNTYRTQQIMTLDVLTSLQKSLETCPTADSLSEDPKALKLELMPHQKFAISWLLWREKQRPHGGILADDMGLGKTLTMISLILKTSEMFGHLEDEDLLCTAIKGGTLIICPSSLMNQWKNEITTKVRSGTIDVIQHYGPNRESSARRLARKDVVITTYNVVMWDQKNHQDTSPIFQIKWNRIILDEAHTIRNYKSQTSVAVSCISGINRWALTGTPVHNKESDFYALLKFIKCEPFDDWAVWKRWIGNNDQAGKKRLSLLVKTLMLRRTKAELSESSSFKLPPKTFHTVNVELFKEEKDVYEKVLLFSSSLFATYLYEKAEKENAVEFGFSIKKKHYLHKAKWDENMFQNHPELDRLFKQLMKNEDIKAHHILVLLLRLRQLCCHPSLMKNLLEAETLKVDGIQDTEDLGLVDQMSRMSIGVPSTENPGATDSNPIFSDSWLSSKIKAVCDMVEQKVLHSDDKAVIVSQWPSMLDLVNKQLSQYKVRTELFSGKVPIPIRNKLVEDFNNSKGGPKILLLSLTAGGVGLNLVAANHLFLVDIHWNPQLEAQACDRIYRVGQKKPVNVYKFICNNTIETSIQTIQEHKLAIAKTLFGGCTNIEGTKITLEDLKQIFQFNPNQ